MLPYLVGNVGFVFTKDDLSDIKDKILANKVAAPAKVGSLAQCDVVLPAQNTGMGPEKTSFFQALSIPTKISRGTIEILVRRKMKGAIIFHLISGYIRVSERSEFNQKR